MKSQQAGHDVGDLAVALHRAPERPLGVGAAPVMDALELIEPDAERGLSARELRFDRVQHVGDQSVGLRRLGADAAEVESDAREAAVGGDRERDAELESLGDRS